MNKRQSVGRSKELKQKQLQNKLKDKISSMEKGRETKKKDKKKWRHFHCLKKNTFSKF